MRRAIDKAKRSSSQAQKFPRRFSKTKRETAKDKGENGQI